MVKSEMLATMQTRLDQFLNVDLDKYRNLSADLKIAQSRLHDNQKELSDARKLLDETNEHCRSKDRQIAALKRLMQHAIFHMLIDVQEMVDRT